MGSHVNVGVAIGRASFTMSRMHNRTRQRKQKSVTHTTKNRTLWRRATLCLLLVGAAVWAAWLAYPLSSQQPSDARGDKIAGDANAFGRSTARIPTPEATVGGVVFDPEGRPAANVTVSMDDGDTAVVTSLDGRFRFDDLMTGPHLFVASTSSSAAPAVELIVAPGQHARVQLQLRDGVSLSVDVTDHATGDPVPGARGFVMIEKFGASVRLAGKRIGGHGSGRLVFPAYTHGAVTLHVNAQGYAATETFVTGTGQRGAEWHENVVLTAGQARCGVVEDETGSPIAGANVMWTAANVGPNRVPVQTGPSGAFCVVAADTLIEVRIAHPTFVDVVQPVRDSGASELRIVMASGRQARGHVVNRAGEPVAGAIVSTRGPGMPGGKQVVADDSGLFSMVGLPYDLDLSMLYGASSQARSDPVRLTKDAEDLITIKLVHDAVVRGHVVDANGAPAPNASVSFQGPEAPLSGGGLWFAGNTVTGRDGSFEIRALASGRYGATVAAATKPNELALPLRSEHTFEAGETGLRLALPATTIVTGTVVARGQPVPQFSVRMVGGTVAKDVDDEGGRFRIGPVAAVEAAGELEISANGFVLATRTVNAMPGADCDLGEIALEPGQVLAGRVLDLQGQGIGGALITVRSDQPDATLSADAFGNFAVTVRQLPVSLQAVQVGVGASQVFDANVARDNIELRAPALGRLEVRLEGGAHLTGLMLWAVDPAIGAHQLASIPRVAVGESEFAGDVAPGEYVIQLPGLGDHSADDSLATVVIKPDQTRRVVLAAGPVSSDFSQPTAEGQLLPTFEELRSLLPPLPKQDSP